ncbi:MAG: hypothetical protein Q7S01_04480 [bacterium]|nr:hypothetical protein [bacterium]
MTYKLVEPEITNIAKATWLVYKDAWNKVSTKWEFWAIFLLLVVFFWYVIPIILIISSIVIQFYLRSTFWKQLAKVNGWQYKDVLLRSFVLERGRSPVEESGIMFEQGHGRAITHEIEGVIEGRHFRIFNYQFNVGHGKSRDTYYYTVFHFKFNGLFPHLYLNNKNNAWSISAGEKIPLPAEFEKEFSLSAPRKYEIEALEIFTPDVLAKLLDDNFPHDVEFTGHDVYIFTDGQINNFEQFEKELNYALELEDLFDEKLDTHKFQQIGDMPYSLTL